jgi:hypothetical protein
MNLMLDLLAIAECGAASENISFFVESIAWYYKDSME